MATSESRTTSNAVRSWPAPVTASATMLSIATALALAGEIERTAIWTRAELMARW